MIIPFEETGGAFLTTPCEFVRSGNSWSVKVGSLTCQECPNFVIMDNDTNEETCKGVKIE